MRCERLWRQDFLLTHMHIHIYFVPLVLLVFISPLSYALFQKHARWPNERLHPGRTCIFCNVNVKATARNSMKACTMNGSNSCVCTFQENKERGVQRVQPCVPHNCHACTVDFAVVIFCQSITLHWTLALFKLLWWCTGIFFLLLKFHLGMERKLSVDFTGFTVQIILPLGSKDWIERLE